MTDQPTNLGNAKRTMAVINNIFVSRHPTDRSFFSKNPHFLKSGGRKNFRKSNYRNPLFCRYVILTHGLSKMTVTNELYAFSTDFFTFTSTKSCKLARWRLSSGIWGVNRVNKKIRKKHFSRLFLLPTDRKITKILLMTAHSIL